MKQYIFLTVIVLLMFACSKNDATVAPDAPPSAPAKASLVYPAQNTLCLIGTITSPSQADITFTWTGGNNTDSYQVDVTNLFTAATVSQSTTTSLARFTLSQNTPYSWSVTAKSKTSATVTKSDVWRFYVSGEGVLSYAPFAADLLTPYYGQNITKGTTSVNLVWNDTDVDNDLVSYDLYFGTAKSPVLYKASITDKFLNNVPVIANTTYYWKIKATDAQGNTSTSQISQFQVN